MQHATGTLIDGCGQVLARPKRFPMPRSDLSSMAIGRGASRSGRSPRASVIQRVKTCSKVFDVDLDPDLPQTAGGQPSPTEP